MKTSTRPKRLKAYEVREDYEGHCVIAFGEGNAQARRAGGAELDLMFEEVDSCRRAPQYDHYAPGPVPALVLIEDGWWFHCSHCDARVSDDEEEGQDPRDDGVGGVFCCGACEAKHYRNQRGIVTAKANLLEAFEARFPTATATRVHVYDGGPLRTTEQHHNTVCFTFPGAKHGGGNFDLAEPAFVMMANGDLEAWHAWLAAGSPASALEA